MNVGKNIILMMLAAVIFAGCETMQNALNFSKPAAQMTGLKFENVKLDSATLLFDIEVDNPYPVALPLMNLDYDTMLIDLM